MAFKQELKKPKYWIHLGLIALILMFGLNIIFKHDMVSVAWFFKFTGLLALGDFLAHTLLGLD